MGTIEWLLVKKTLVLLFLFKVLKEFSEWQERDEFGGPVRSSHGKHRDRNWGLEMIGDKKARL